MDNLVVGSIIRIGFDNAVVLSLEDGAPYEAQLLDTGASWTRPQHFSFVASPSADGVAAKLASQEIF